MRLRQVAPNCADLQHLSRDLPDLHRLTTLVFFWREIMLVVEGMSRLCFGYPPGLILFYPGR